MIHSLMNGTERVHPTDAKTTTTVYLHLEVILDALKGLEMAY